VESFTSTLLLILLYIGITKNWWPSIAASPVGKSLGLVAPAAVVPPPDAPADSIVPAPGGTTSGSSTTAPAAAPQEHADDPQPRGVDGSNREIERAVRKKNLLEVISSSLGSHTTRALCLCLSRVAQPVEREHGATIKLLKEPAKASQWVVAMASGKRLYLSKVIEQYVCPKLQHYSGLHCNVALPPWTFSADERQDISDTMCDFICNLVASESLHCMLYSHTLPGKFFALVDSNADVRREALAFCRRSWRALERLEEEAMNDQDIKAWIPKLLWPCAPWPREVLCGLLECGDFKEVPADIHQELLEASELLGTKDVEDLFNFSRSQQRQNKAGKLSRLALFHRAVYSKFLSRCGKVQRRNIGPYPYPRPPAKYIVVEGCRGMEIIIDPYR